MEQFGIDSTHPFKRNRKELRARAFDPRKLEHVVICRGLWYESEAEIERSRRAAETRERRMRWVRARMKRLLTPEQRRCVNLHYLEGLTYRQIAAQTGLSIATISRRVRKAITILREAARNEGMV